MLLRALKAAGQGALRLRLRGPRLLAAPAPWTGRGCGHGGQRSWAPAGARALSALSQKEAAGARAAEGEGEEAGAVRSTTKKGRRWRRRRDAVPLPPPAQSREAAAKEEEVRLLKEQTQESMSTVLWALGGNVVITVLKFAVWMRTGSSAMLSETIHSLVDSGNQALLLIGQRNALLSPDETHQYGYGKAIYFWCLVSALGTFWLGTGVSMRNAVEELLHPSVDIAGIGWETWGVLAASFIVEGYIFQRTLRQIRRKKPKDVPLLRFIREKVNPTETAVLAEDGASCLGVLVAVAGIGATQLSGNPAFDAAAGIGISALLAGVGFLLARLNQQYLLGQAVAPEITDDIRNMLIRRPSVDSVQQVKSQWVGPFAFHYRAEVDFDGTYFAARLFTRYQQELNQAISGKQALQPLLGYFAEDVIRSVEREVSSIENEIRDKYPHARFIEFEPAAKDSHQFALEDHSVNALARIEADIMQRVMRQRAAEQRRRMRMAVEQQNHQQQHQQTTPPGQDESRRGRDGFDDFGDEDARLLSMDAKARSQSTDLSYGSEAARQESAIMLGDDMDASISDMVSRGEEQTGGTGDGDSDSPNTAGNATRLRFRLHSLADVGDALPRWGTQYAPRYPEDEHDGDIVDGTRSTSNADSSGSRSSDSRSETTAFGDDPPDSSSHPSEERAAESHKEDGAAHRRREFAREFNMRTNAEYYDPYRFQEDESMLVSISDEELAARMLGGVATGHFTRGDHEDDGEDGDDEYIDASVDQEATAPRNVEEQVWR